MLVVLCDPDFFFLFHFNRRLKENNILANATLTHPFKNRLIPVHLKLLGPKTYWKVCPFFSRRISVLSDCLAFVSCRSILNHLKQEYKSVTITASTALFLLLFSFNNAVCEECLKVFFKKNTESLKL